MGTLAAYVLPLQSNGGSDDNPLLEASPGLMIWTLVIFGITLFILKRYVFGPVGQAIEKRRNEIAKSIEEAERSRDEATALLEDYKTRLAEARREADALRDQGRKEGERQAQEIVTNAHGQRDRLLSDAETQIQAEARAAASGLRDEVAAIALMAAEKVSRRSLDDDDHRRLIEEALEEADLSAIAANGKPSGNGAAPTDGKAGSE
jgi:F-type H+-transporting ATPase subunit b